MGSRKFTHKASQFNWGITVALTLGVTLLESRLTNQRSADVGAEDTRDGIDARPSMD
jgi:hypothetical protein